MPLLLVPDCTSACNFAISRETSACAHAHFFIIHVHRRLWRNRGAVNFSALPYGTLKKWLFFVSFSVGNSDESERGKGIERIKRKQNISMGKVRSRQRHCLKRGHRKIKHLEKMSMV